jgi:chaperone modulatory protein CbpM
VKKHVTLHDAVEFLGIEQIIVTEMIQHEWVHPVAEHMLNEEDIARIQLILELRDLFGANDNAIPVILHLIDQLYYLRNTLFRLSPGNK